jgi:hypothetical protein
MIFYSQHRYMLKLKYEVVSSTVLCSIAITGYNLLLRRDN